jgi:hypothetical protein
MRILGVQSNFFLRARTLLLTMFRDGKCAVPDQPRVHRESLTK